MPYIGPHIDFSGDFEILIDFHKKLKNNLFQIFRIPDKRIKNLEKFKKYIKKNDIKIFVHASYTINLAADWLTNYSAMLFIDEIQFANKIGATGIVVHFGKYKQEMTKSQAINNMFTSLLTVHKKTKNLPIKILLETPAGQGTELCYDINDLAAFYKKIKDVPGLNNRIGICVDTCHIFSAGYDLVKKKDVVKYLHKFDELIGITNLWLVHLNDSKVARGARVDRHAPIGKGYIGIRGLKKFYKICTKKYNVPIVIETYLDYDKEILELV